MIATTPVDILRFLLARGDEKIDTVLVTLTGIEGTSSRAIGTQMAVAADGRYAGSFSGGCVEAAVVAEALGTLANDRAKLVRFGVDSPYLDIRLPCGGGIDLLFNPRPHRGAIAEALARLDARNMAALRLSREGIEAMDADPNGTGPGWRGNGFDIVYRPALRIAAIGQGEDLTAFARLAHGFGAEVAALSPEKRTLAELAVPGIETIALVTRTRLPAVRTDPWTAIVFLFHDRDWEEELLPQALSLPGFYFGAVGSPRTHAARLERLAAAGVPEALRRALRGPVGLIPATRDPATLALSVLSEVVCAYQVASAPRGTDDPLARLVFEPDA